VEFQSSRTWPVSEAELVDAAQTLGCELKAIKAVSQVEAPGGGFLPAPDNRPVILFESHTFHTETNGKYDVFHPGISTPHWIHNYGEGGAHQYDRLHEAILLDRKAALCSASWGKYQIMGLNYINAGYDGVEQFVDDMCYEEGYHLDAFVTFLQNTGIDQALIDKDWLEFARRYNGVGQIDAYAGRIAEAYLNG
jgi:N-acetylmuramidase